MFFNVQPSSACIHSCDEPDLSRFQDNTQQLPVRSPGKKADGGSEQHGLGQWPVPYDWLNIMYPRIKLARNLLREDGAIFISLGGRQLRTRLCDDILAMVIWQKVFSPKNTAAYFSEDHDYIGVYANQGGVEPRLLPRSEEAVGGTRTRTTILAGLGSLAQFRLGTTTARVSTRLPARPARHSPIPRENWRFSPSDSNN